MNNIHLLSWRRSRIYQAANAILLTGPFIGVGIAALRHGNASLALLILVALALCIPILLWVFRFKIVYGSPEGLQANGIVKRQMIPYPSIRNVSEPHWATGSPWRHAIVDYVDHDHVRRIRFLLCNKKRRFWSSAPIEVPHENVAWIQNAIKASFANGS
jgi:hypothetical protein